MATFTFCDSEVHKGNAFTIPCALRSWLGLCLSPGSKGHSDRSQGTGALHPAALTPHSWRPPRTHAVTAAERGTPGPSIKSVGHRRGPRNPPAQSVCFVLCRGLAAHSGGVKREGRWPGICAGRKWLLRPVSCVFKAEGEPV